MGEARAEIEIRFSVDRYNPAPASQTVQSGLLDADIPVETSDITATGTRAETGLVQGEGLKRERERERE